MASFVSTAPVDGNLEKANYLPTNIVRSGNMSVTNHAYTCFVKQRFSSDMQAFLINYVASILSREAVYK